MYQIHPSIPLTKLKSPMSGSVLIERGSLALLYPLSWLEEGSNSLLAVTVSGSFVEVAVADGYIEVKSLLITSGGSSTTVEVTVLELE